MFPFIRLFFMNSFQATRPTYAAVYMLEYISMKYIGIGLVFKTIHYSGNGRENQALCSRNYYSLPIAHSAERAQSTSSL